MRTTHRLLLLALVCALLLAACGQATSETSTFSDGGVIEEIAPEDRVSLEPFSGETLEDGFIDVADYSGRVLVLNVWGSWCVPCRAEAPVLARASTEFEQVQFLGINVRDNDDSAIAFERNYGITYPSITTDASTQAMLAIGDVVPRSAVPTTVVVGRDGKVTSRVVGPSTYATLKALVSAALAESEPVQGSARVGQVKTGQ